MMLDRLPPSKTVGDFREIYSAPGRTAKCWVIATNRAIRACLAVSPASLLDSWRRFRYMKRYGWSMRPRGASIARQP